MNSVTGEETKEECDATRSPSWNLGAAHQRECVYFTTETKGRLSLRCKKPGKLGKMHKAISCLLLTKKNKQQVLNHFKLPFTFSCMKVCTLLEGVHFQVALWIFKTKFNVADLLLFWSILKSSSSWTKQFSWGPSHLIEIRQSGTKFVKLPLQIFLEQVLRAICWKNVNWVFFPSI